MTYRHWMLTDHQIKKVVGKHSTRGPKKYENRVVFVLRMQNLKLNQGEALRPHSRLDKPLLEENEDNIYL